MSVRIHETAHAATHRDTVPILVDHHHAQKHAQCEKEQPVNVMLDGVAYRRAKGEQEDLCNREERRPEDNITDRPSIF